MANEAAFGRKEFILAAFTVGAGLLNALSWQAALRAGTYGVVLYSWPMLALFFFTVCFALAMAFIRARAVRIAASVLSLSSAYALMPYRPLFTGAFVLTALAALYAGQSIATEHRAAAFFSVRKIYRTGLPMFFTGLALALAMFYFSGLSPDPAQSSLVPRTLFDAVLPLVKGQIQKLLPGFSPDAPVDDLVFAVIRREPQAGSIDLLRLPEPERKALVRQARESFSKELGVELSGKETSAEALYKISNAQALKLAGPVAPYVPVLAAAGFFIAVKALTLPVYWLSLILIAGVIKLLLSTGFLKERTETAEIKRLVL